MGIMEKKMETTIVYSFLKSSGSAVVVHCGAENMLYTGDTSAYLGIPALTAPVLHDKHSKDSACFT